MRFYRELPTKNGAQLFLVKITGYYYTTDPKDSGTHRLSHEPWLVMARDRKTALQKLDSKITEFLKDYGVKRENVKIIVTALSLEELVVAYETNDGQLVKAKLEPANDRQTYNLLACLAEK